MTKKIVWRHILLDSPSPLDLPLYSPPPVINCHTFSDPVPLEHDVLYRRPQVGSNWQFNVTPTSIDASRTSLPTLIHNGLYHTKANMLAKTHADTSSTANCKQEFLQHIHSQNHTTNHTTQNSQRINNEEIEAINEEYYSTSIKTMLTFCNNIWREVDLPNDWNNAIINPNSKASHRLRCPRIIIIIIIGQL